MSRKLVVSDGTRDRELQLVGRLVVGRDPSCDISHDHALLSRRHAEFVTAADGVTVRDLGSRNGVFVNGARAAERALEPGDVVQIGPLRARYVLDTRSGITPEEMDSERTVVIRDPSPAALPGDAVRRAVSPPAAVDDEVTRLIRAPRAPQPPAHDDDRTGFIAAPLAAIQLTAAEAAAAAAPTGTLPRPVGQGGPAAPLGPPLSSFVFGQVLLLAGLVLAAAAVPALVWRRALLTGSGAGGAAPSLLWLALPAAVGAVAAWIVGAAINRRFTRALTMVQRNRIQGL